MQRPIRSPHTSSWAASSPSQAGPIQGTSDLPLGLVFSPPLCLIVALSLGLLPCKAGCGLGSMQPTHPPTPLYHPSWTWSRTCCLVATEGNGEGQMKAASVGKWGD